MKFEIDIPEYLLSSFQSECSRRVIQRRFGLTEHMARYYRSLSLDLKKQRPLMAAMADCHVPYHDKAAYETILVYLSIVQPEILVLLGDFADFYRISHWRTDPKRMRFREELRIIREELARLAALFPKSRRIFLLGNHEERMLAYLQDKSAEISDLDALGVPSLLKLKEYGFEFIDTVALLGAGKPPLTIGGFALLHGHETRVRGGVNIPRNVVAQTAQPIIFGHFHKSDRHAKKTLVGEYREGYLVGCCCRLSEPYAPVNDWNHGFLEMYRTSQNHIIIKNRRVINGEII